MKARLEGAGRHGRWTLRIAEPDYPDDDPNDSCPSVGKPFWALSRGPGSPEVLLRGFRVCPCGTGSRSQSQSALTPASRPGFCCLALRALGGGGCGVFFPRGVWGGQVVRCFFASGFGVWSSAAAVLCPGSVLVQAGGCGPMGNFARKCGLPAGPACFVGIGMISGGVDLSQWGACCDLVV